MASVKLKSSGSGLDSLSAGGKVALGALFVVLVGVAYFLVFYGDVEAQIESKRQTVVAKRAELERAKEVLAAYNADREELERRRLLEQKQKKILPDESQSHAFLSSLQTVATISGIDLASWTPQDEIAEDFYARVPMELTLRGQFHQVAKFFYGVGQVYRIINIENIVLKVVPQRATKEPEEGEANATVEVKCLATAFRALGDKDQGGNRRRGRGRGQ